MKQKETASTLHGVTPSSEAKSLREISKSGVYELRTLLPLAKKELVEKRGLGNDGSVADAEAIIYLRNHGYKFIERTVIP